MLDGSVDSFVSMMNTKANELNLTNTNFTNTYGLDDENHYTSAKDLAYIMDYCLQNSNFRKIAGQASCAIPATNKSGTRKYNSTNEIIIPTSKYYYKYSTAGKTGFTTPAGNCLVSSAYKDDLELICVVLNSNKNDSNSRFVDTTTLFEYGYSNYSVKNIVNENDVITSIEIKNATKETKNLDLYCSESIPVLANNSSDLTSISPNISLNENISAPILQGDILGSVTYSVDGVDYTTNIIASHDVEKSYLLNYIIAIILVILILTLVLKLSSKKNNRKKKRYKTYIR